MTPALALAVLFCFGADVDAADIDSHDEVAVADESAADNEAALRLSASLGARLTTVGGALTLVDSIGAHVVVADGVSLGASGFFAMRRGPLSPLRAAWAGASAELSTAVEQKALRPWAGFFAGGGGLFDAKDGDTAALVVLEPTVGLDLTVSDALALSLGGGCVRDREPVFASPRAAMIATITLRNHVKHNCIALCTYCIMPDHVHLLLVAPGVDLMRFVGEVKNLIQRELWRHRVADLIWQRQSWDRFVRSDEAISSVIKYILMNPVRAGICQLPREYPFSGVLREVRRRAASPPRTSTGLTGDKPLHSALSLVADEEQATARSDRKQTFGEKKPFAMEMTKGPHRF